MQKKRGRHKRLNGALLHHYSNFVPFCCITESAGALLPWGGLRGTKEKEPDWSVRGDGL